MPRYSHAQVIQPTSCTVQLNGGNFCDADGAPDMPFAICAPHALELFRRMQAMVAEVQENQLDHTGLYVAACQDVARERYERDNSPSHQVYYLRVGDLIKIGMTKQLRQRISSYPPGSKLLATERGGEAVEFRRLNQFRHLLAERNEWFRPGQDLLDHIASLNKAA